MYALVKKILDKSREKKVDVVTARDMVVADGNDYDAVKAAYAIVSKYYDVITFYRRNADEAGIENICNLYEEGKIAELDAFVAKLKEDNNL